MEKGCGKRFLRWTGPMGRRVLRFDSAFGAEGCGIALRAMSLKSALRDFPPDTVILSLRRRISVHAAFETSGLPLRDNKYICSLPKAMLPMAAFILAPTGAYLASAAILCNYPGRSPQPVREASAGPGQNPWGPGPKARRPHQPSPASAGVNLREYQCPPLLNLTHPHPD